MAVEIPIWPGSGSFTSGSSTPFGYYDSDTQFQNDAPVIARKTAESMGFPIVDIELQDIHFFTNFEEAVTVYSSYVNEYNVRDNLINLQGTDTGSNLTHRNISPNFNRIIEIADEYGTEIGVGGNVDVKTGSIDLVSDKQVYDLNALWADVSESGNRIEIRNIFYENSPASSRMFDPYVGNLAVLDEFGWGNYSAGGVHLLRPLHHEALKMQAIEFNDTIRKSAYTFELINNKLRIFPIPKSSKKLFFEYILKDDRANALKLPDGKISDYSNTTYNNMKYSQINDIGKNWIKRYTLALCKETLGMIRSKFAGIPGAGGTDITLDGDSLKQQAETEKETLITELKDTLEQLSRRSQLERKEQESEHLQNQLYRMPLKFYIK